MSVEDELIKIRMELEGQREAVTGIKEVVTAEKGLATSTKKSGDEAERASKKQLSLGRAYSETYSKAKLALGFIGFGGVFAIESAVHHTEELAKTTSGLTRNFDLNTNVASRWGAVAYARDIDAKALGMTFGTLSTKLTNAAREGGKALLPFHQLGLTQEDAAKGAHNFQWGIMRVAEALGEEEGGAKRAAAAKSLLGKGYATLLPLFSEGAEGLRENLKLSDEYGVTLNGKTNDAVMGMVNSQRELKLASLGIQIAMTKALMPAIEGGEDQVKEFIKTLNDPDLTADQKIHRIVEQFEGLEDDLVRILEQALPVVAKHAGQLGLKMAGAVGHGFLHSNFGGKLLISAWLLKAMGGDELIAATAKSIGVRIGSKLGTGVAVGIVAGLVGYEIYEQMSQRTKDSLHEWAIGAGQDFVNFFVDILNTGIREINQALDDANALSVLGVDAPNIGEVGHVNFESDGERERRRVRKLIEEGYIEGPGGKPIKPNPFAPGAIAPGAGGKSSHKRPKAASMRAPELPSIRWGYLHGGGPQRVVVQAHFHLDKKEIAEAVAEATLDAESLG